MKSNIVLKFLWLEDYIGVSLDYKVGNKTIPAFSYYFWPKTDAWEDIKNELEKSNLFPSDTLIFVLNNITDVINFWEFHNKDLEKVILSTAKNKFPSCVFFGYN